MGVVFLEPDALGPVDLELLVELLDRTDCQACVPYRVAFDLVGDGLGPLVINDSLAGGDDYFCRSHVVIIRYRRCRIGYGSASRITEAKTDGRKETTDLSGGGHGGDERAVGAEVAVWPVALGDQDRAPVAHPARSL